jgi:hypothetical protein
MTAVVRWESAAPLQAVAKSKLPGELSSYYVISVSGLAMLSDLGASLGDDGLAALKKATSLDRSGKKPVAPANITMPFDQAGVMLFCFSKDDPISAAEKQVVFQTKLQNMGLKAKFVPKEMEYQGKLAL